MALRAREFRLLRDRRREREHRLLRDRVSRRRLLRRLLLHVRCGPGGGGCCGGCCPGGDRCRASATGNGSIASASHDSVVTACLVTNASTSSVPWQLVESDILYHIPYIMAYTTMSCEIILRIIYYSRVYVIGPQCCQNRSLASASLILLGLACALLHFKHLILYAWE
jgi:hypothetical protein